MWHRKLNTSSIRHVQLIWCIFLVHYFCASVAAEPTIVQVQQGAIQGVEISSKAGKPFIAFKGIPYAQPPIGKLRLKAPQPVDKWDETLHATQDGSPCMQYNKTSEKVIGDEDCLYLNVFIPKISSDKSGRKFPVLVFIHGGHFQYGSGSSDVYPPNTFTDNDIIMVSMNYRLGVLGFISLADETIPGNFGLLDQLEALRWIQQNIGYFGGDVQQVTLLGHGAGAASALFHMLSPLSKGLFHQVIALSGTPISDMSFQKDPIKETKELGIQLDCFTINSFLILDCLRKNLAEDIVAATEKMHKISHHPLIFLPVVERVHNQNGDFLPDTPRNLLKEGKINHTPVIFGVSRSEGALFYKDVRLQYAHEKEDFFTDSLPRILESSTNLKHNLKDISLAMKERYFSNIDISNKAEVDNATIEMYADMLVRRFTDTTAKHLSSAGWPTYMYIVDDDSGLESLDIHSELQYPDELKYIFLNDEDVNKKLNDDDQKNIKIIKYVWMNFIKTSMPTPTKSPILPLTWIPMNPGKIRYLKIASKAEIVEGFLTSRMKFWNSEIPKIEAHGKAKDEL